jgi:plasmid stabilization system protein ParE
VILLIRASKPASQELAEAVRWYEIRRAGLGGEFFDAVTHALALIEAQPEIGTPLRPDLGVRRLLLARFPFQVVYRLRPSEIVVIAIAHLRRRPAYWKRRT